MCLKKKKKYNPVVKLRLCTQLADFITKGVLIKKKCKLKMVAIKNVEDEYSHNSKTLGDWVKDFRLKRTQMKRKFRSGNLRICAILSTALTTAEFELRRKQQDRFQKWLEFQTKINKNVELQPKSELHHQLQRHQKNEEEKLVVVTNRQSEDVDCKQSEAIANLWKCELNELDNFMRSISSCNKSQNAVEPNNSNQKNLQTYTMQRSS